MARKKLTTAPVRKLTEDEARRHARGPLGRELQEVVFQYAKAIYWTVSPHPNGVDDIIRNGTTFFLDCGKGVFGVTAGHVYDGFLEAAPNNGRTDDPDASATAAVVGAVLAGMALASAVHGFVGA